MGFKWFKARITISRMPEYSSAAAGSYRTTSFDMPDFQSNNNYTTSTNGQTNIDKTSITRPVSLPALKLNNPVAEVTGTDNISEAVELNSSDNSSKSSKKTSDVTQSGREMYSGLGIRNTALLKKETFEEDYNQNIGNVTPRPAQKMHKAEYKRKKVKAPVPKRKLSKSSGDILRSGNSEGVTFTNEKKSSHTSDVDV
nr:uncharacterized protein LOC124221346 isoform X1 [Neodiprion pinetum]XP_046487216.1 uncharacterized protein LOC124221346 isoform X1 [Neodiprion pinetum]XP_046487217.1 uncharacterized protein LOC124221346 isoform X1 [Neodiprion pinetum]XP_046487218.1 uncharacterized protein LOC124221346 isoform X1 [Neodiprion pinetum]XP_046487219.1 uncharacterized protein LOC124221346 isoform X1 [Neodiprion pinetum]XP_046487220.1 uncharacterized protein LOC124221346 isoform X1 [Neodiprion pinetum]XP_04648722